MTFDPVTVTVTVRPADVVLVVDDDVADVADGVPLELAELVVDEAAVALVDAGGAGGVLEEEHAPTSAARRPR